MLKNFLTYGATFLAGLFAGGMLMQRAIKKQMNAMLGNMDPGALTALTQQMGGRIPQVGGINPLAGKIDPATLNVINQQVANMDPAMRNKIAQELANMDPATLNAINQELANMDPAQLNAMAAQMGLALPGSNLNVMSSPSTITPSYSTQQVPVKRAPIMPLNLTASQLGTGGKLRI